MREKQRGLKLMSPKNRNILIIAICALIGVAVVLTVGIGNIVETTFYCAIAGIVIGAIIAALDGVISVLVFNREVGFWLYKSSPWVRFVSAMILAVVFFVAKLGDYLLPLDVAMIFVWVPALLIGFLLGSLMFSNRDSIAKAAHDIGDGTIDYGAAARGAGAVLRDTAVTGLGEAAHDANEVATKIDEALP
jgi:hypothetical protein